MYFIKLLLILFVTVLLVCAAPGQSLVLNEVVSKNSGGLEDDDGDSSDWIELYNGSTQAVDLQGYGISDDLDQPTKWVFPSILLGPGEFLIVFASAKDRDFSPFFHTNFRVSGAGEDLLLVDPSGVLIDQVYVPELQENEAFARVPNGASQWWITPMPTPSGANIGNQLIFSHEEGAYPEAFELSVQGDFADTIYFTRDGSIPTLTDEVLDAELTIGSRVGDPNLFSEIVTTPGDDSLSYKGWVSPTVELHKCHVLRFASFLNGERTSPVYTKTYFADGLLEDRYTVPVVSLVSDSQSFFSVDTGIYVKGIHFEPDSAEWSGNSFKRGEDWERKVHFTYFEADGNTVITQDAGIRISGGKTRQAGQKSFRLYARSNYGKDEFNHQFFKERSHSDYQRLTLRTSVGAWRGPTVINDVLAHRIVEDLDFESQANQPVVVYLNGEYWGLYTLIDRVDERYIEYETGVDTDSVVIWDWLQGDYYDVVGFAEREDLSLDANYQVVADQIDIGSFIDYNIAQQFFANRDWPWTNTVHWRKSHNGKWRFIFYDLDAGFTFPDRDMFEYMMVDPASEGEWNHEAFSTALYRNLLDNEGYRERYISRYKELLNSTLSSDSTLGKLEEIRNLYAPEIESQADRWAVPPSKFEWDDLVDVELEDFLIRRPCVVDVNLASFFQLTDYEYLCDTVELQGEVLVAPNPSSGDLFIYNSTENKITFSELKVFNTIGQLVYALDEVVLNSRGRFDFRIPSPVNGLYFISMQNGDERIEKRIIIQHN